MQGIILPHHHNYCRYPCNPLIVNFKLGPQLQPHHQPNLSNTHQSQTQHTLSRQSAQYQSYSQPPQPFHYIKLFYHTSSYEETNVSYVKHFNVLGSVANLSLIPTRIQTCPSLTPPNTPSPLSTNHHITLTRAL